MAVSKINLRGYTEIRLVIIQRWELMRLISPLPSAPSTPSWKHVKDSKSCTKEKRATFAIGVCIFKRTFSVLTNQLRLKKKLRAGGLWTGGPGCSTFVFHNKSLAEDVTKCSAQCARTASPRSFLGHVIDKLWLVRLYSSSIWGLSSWRKQATACSRSCRSPWAVKINNSVSESSGNCGKSKGGKLRLIYSQYETVRSRLRFNKKHT